MSSAISRAGSAGECLVAAVSVEMPKSAKAMVWTGRAVTGLVALFLAFDSGIKLMQLDAVREAMDHSAALEDGQLGSGMGVDIDEVGRADDSHRPARNEAKHLSLVVHYADLSRLN